MAGFKRAVLLINTHSRKGKDLLGHAEQSLRDHGVEVTRTHALEDPRQIDEAVAGIVEEGTELLIVGSGDGTISEVVDHLAYEKAMGRPSGLRGGRTKSSPRHRSSSTTISANSKQYEYDTHQIVIANGHFYAGTLIARDASIDNHSLIIFQSSRIQLLAAYYCSHSKGLAHCVRGNFIVTTEANITTSPPCRVEIDGEIKATTPIEASVASGALEVMVGQNFRR